MSTNQRKGVVVAVIALLLAGVIGAVWAYVTSFAADRIEAEASTRGVALEFDGIDVWPNGLVRLHDVKVTRGSLRAQIEVLAVDARVLDGSVFSGQPSIASIEVHGARVEQVEVRSETSRKGEVEDSDVMETLKRLGGGTMPRIVATDLEVALGEVDAKVGEVELTAEDVAVRNVAASGARLERFVTKPVTVAEARITPAIAVLRRDRAAVERLEVSGLSVETELTKLRAFAPRATDDGDAAGSTTAAEPYNDRAHRLLNRAFFLGAGAVERVGAAAPAEVKLTKSTVTLVDREVVATGVDATWNRAEQTIEVEAGVMHQSRDAGRVSARFEHAAPAWTFGAKGLDLSFGRLLHEKSPFSGRADVEVRIERSDDTFGLSGRIAAHDATVTAAQLADEPVVFTDATYDFEGVYAPMSESLGEPKLVGNPTGGVHFSKAERRGSFEMTRGELEAPGLAAQVRFAVYGLGSLPIWPARVDVHLELPKTPAQAVVDMIPAQLLGDIHGAKFGGHIEASVDIELPLQRASRMRWKIDERLHDFEILHLPEQVDVRRLMGPMKTKIGSGDPCRLEIAIPAMRSDKDARAVKAAAAPIETEGCVPWSYTPLDAISDYIHRGILTTEDGAFYRHTGFNEDAIRKSLEKNIVERRFARGASTISMQFTKNLFLSKDKQAARKLREAILVYLMESVVKVPKKRIMEVYLNIIEYGVGVYGIGAAAQHYFGKKPSELTVVEVAWIITLIPGPRARYPYFKRRTIPDEWWERIQLFLDEMYRKERLDEFELLTAKAHPPQFRDGSGTALNDPARFRPQVAPLARKMQAFRETGMSREAIIEWSKKVAR